MEKAYINSKLHKPVMLLVNAEGKEEDAMRMSEAGRGRFLGSGLRAGTL